MPTFTGLQRSRRTTRAVAIADRVSRWTITVGGIATILAVATVCLFLVYVVLPLLVGGSVTPAGSQPTPAPGRMLAAGEDEYRRLAWTLRDDGMVRALVTDSGQVLASELLYAPAEVTTVQVHDRDLLLGYRNGQVEQVKIGVASQVLGLGDAPAVTHQLAVGSTAIEAGSLYERTSKSTVRRQQLEVARDAKVALGEFPVLHVDGADTPNGTMIAAVTSDGTLHLKTRSERMNMVTEEVTVTLEGASVRLAELVPNLVAQAPDHVLLAGAGDNVYLIWNNGRLVRLDTRSIDTPRFAEELQLLPGGATVTSVAFLIGKQTLLVGDDRGDVGLWFKTKPPNATPHDGATLVRARSFAPAQPAAVVSLHASVRSRLFTVLRADGTAEVLHGTSERLVAGMQIAADDRPALVRMAVKEDGVLVFGERAMHRWDLRAGHPEVTLASTFLPVWYEGYNGPEHVWQSTSGSDDFEPKLGLWTLIFGTLKATLYCLLFGVPLALLAAIYTSEFLHPRWKARIKPSIELMASLPSVVLGFLAALVFAPVVEAHLMMLLLLVLTLPIAFLIGANLWQALPPRWRTLGDRFRLLGGVVALPLGLCLAMLLAPLVEGLLFGGDLRGWLVTDGDGQAARGSAYGGWLFALLPLAGVGTALAAPMLPFLPARGLPRIGAGTVLALGAAAALAGLCTVLGFDLRGSLVGTFDQRNSLVVGFVMGFAVIPIVYTIAEDALSSVPAHLRAASLGAGATPWQTAVRIVLPTALSGVFSAVMIGLGRAVGETMIVLMAAGNTPVLELNLFNGFRTLSANIATELPEAVRDSTHYRMLYLAALVLFVMTFALNTAAEVIRQRFRKRAFQL
jgi:phosphate transport system permease protein